MIPFDRIVFDCDSTLSAIEGVDQLPCSDPEAVADLTEMAMGGQLPLEQVYGRRMDLLRPSREEVTALGPAYVRALVPGAREVVGALLSLDKEVRVLSGGLRIPVTHLAASLGIPASQVDAVELKFADNGSYSGLDADQPLTRAEGKAHVLASLPPARTALVGDGWTDFLASRAVDLFIGFGGVAVRSAVRDAAQVYCHDPSLTAILPLLLGNAERDQLDRDPPTAGLTNDSPSMESPT